MNIANPALCEWSPAPYLFFSENIWGNFIYYSHIFPSIAALLIAVFVFWENPKGRVNQALLALSLVFTVWCFMDLILWASDRSDIIMFVWSSLIFFDLLLYVSALYFVYAFIDDRWPRWYEELALALMFVPLVLFAHTPLNLTAFDFTNCWREALEGPLWQNYVYNAELLIALWILVFAVRKYLKESKKEKRQEIAWVTVGILFLLVSFSIGNIIGSFAVDWELGQYGLFGMPVFVAFLLYLMVRYRTFNIGILSSEAILVGLGLLVTSLLFVRKLENVQVIAGVTLIMLIILGVLLIRSVRKELNQRTQIEKLYRNLERANTRLKQMDKLKSEFVSIASHQLRSPLTAISGYASLLREGNYGPLPKKMAEPLERIETSAKSMGLAIEDYLNVSRIESGNMKYQKTDFNLKELVERLVDDHRQEAIKAGLVLLFRSDLASRAVVHADRNKVEQIMHNLINNALKYTPKGTITVFMNDNPKQKQIRVSIHDSGIGMSEETLHTIFQKFERANNIQTINVKGTGLGLFVALKMAQAMGGDITAASEGEGKGSTFTLTLPLAL